MEQLNQAYEVLSDEAKRAAYDRERLSNPVFQQNEVRARPRILPRFLLLLALVLVAIVALRFIRNPRVSTIVAVAVAAIWFGPRIFRFLFGKKS
jgi:curved DNA-binding protein CbpA